MSGDIKRIFKHSGVYMVGNLLNRLGAFLLLPLYTNYLSTSHYGILEILYATNALVAMVFGAGLAHATLRFYFDYDSSKDRNSVVTTNFLVSGFFTLIGVALVIIASPKVSTLLMGSNEYAVLVELAVLVIFFEVTTEVCLAYLRAREQSLFFVGLSLLRLLIQVGACIYFVAIMSKGVQGVLWGNLLSVFSIWLVLSIYVFLRCGLHINYKIIRPILIYSLPFAASGIIGVFMVNITLYLLRIYSSLADVGLYGLGMKFAMILRFVVSEPFQRGYGSFRFSVIKQVNAKDIQSQVVHYFIVGSSIVALCIALYTPDVIHIMASEEYWDAAMVTPIILMAFLFSGIRYCFETGILYMKKTRYLLYMSVLSFIVSIVGNVLLIPIWGVYGAACTLMLVNAMLVLTTYSISQRLYSVPYDHIAILKICALLVGVFVFSEILVAKSPGILSRLLMNSGLISLFIFLLYIFDFKSRDLVRIIINYFLKRTVDK